MLTMVNTTTFTQIWYRIKVQSIIPLKFKNNCIISQCNQQQNTKIFIANEMLHVKYIKVNFILTRGENSSIILFSVKVQGVLYFCACNSRTTLLGYKHWNSSEISQNQIRDLAIQLPLHLMRVEYLNPLLAFEPKNLSMLYCTFFSFLQYENMLISQTLCYPFNLKKKN